MELKTGLIKSPQDNRDYILTAFLPPLTVTLPEEWLEWQKWQTPVKYQAGLGACVSFATDGQKEGYDYKELNAVPDLSEQFLYGECKKIDGMPNVEGTHFRAALKVLKDIGVCEEKYFPYEGKFPPSGSPAPGYLDNAKDYKISTYASVGITKEAIKTAIYQNGPILIGVIAHTSFMKTGSDGIVQFPSGKVEGGHALLVVGYNKLGLVCKNSWSILWGNKGYCVIPWAVWEMINLGEAWSIVDVIARKKPWTDWPESELELGWLTKNSGVLKGYEDGTFKPLNNVTQHQAMTIATRLNFTLPIVEDKPTWSTFATRGWIHTNWPQYTFLEERWDEYITRYQFALIIGRYIKEKTISYRVV